MSSINKKRYILIYHYTRCGSTVVSDMLGRVPGCFSYGEIFNPGNSWPARLGLSDYSTGAGANNAITDLIQLLELGEAETLNGESIESFFFEITQWDVYRQVLSFTIKELIDYFNARQDIDFRVVHLIRRNAFLRYLSSELAAFRSVYHSGNMPTDTPKIKLDPTKAIIDIKVHLQRYIEFERALCNLVPIIELSYEDDIQSDPSRAFRKVLSFMSHSTHDIDQFLLEIKPRYAKQINMHPKDIIENFDEIHDVLRQNGFEWMVDN